MIQLYAQLNKHATFHILTENVPDQKQHEQGGRENAKYF